MNECVIDRYSDAEKIVLVMDNLNTHKVASFYEAYSPGEASQLADRLEIHYTPKHGSWLDIAEVRHAERVPRAAADCQQGTAGT